MKMKCGECGGEMEYRYTHERGRHIRDVYFCKKCGMKKEKRIDTLPDHSRLKIK